MSLGGRIIRKALPQTAADRLLFSLHTYRRYWQLKRDLAAMRKQSAACSSLDEKVDVIRNHKVFGAIQQHAEIAGLLKMLTQNPPKYVCEIGTASGGTLFLLAQICSPDALLISVDLGLTLERSLIYARFATGKQRVISIRGDSRAAGTIQRVASILRGRPLDLLFIDGDHAYEGVKADFVNYGPLVRPGGLIAFHDIVRDLGTRCGTPTDHYTGGVPVFWEEIKTQHRVTELIEDPEQDGFGIGVIKT